MSFQNRVASGNLLILVSTWFSQGLDSLFKHFYKRAFAHWRRTSFP